MTWNYRVIHENGYYWVGEVYSDDNFNAIAYSGPIPLQAESIEELRDDLEKMEKAFSKNILEAW